MRIPRRLQLTPSTGTVHKIWRTHNREFLLAPSHIKKLYFDSVERSLAHKKIQSNIQLSAYCLMNNHCHQLLHYTESSKHLSEFMRISHSIFGQRFNRLNNRQGSVAYDRTKTPLIQPDNLAHEIRVHFYIEANPLRAKITKNLKTYKYSSYRFYAWGIRDEFSKLLMIPQWYLRLGKNWKERQARYRKLFDLYLRQSLKKIKKISSSHFLGAQTWIEHKKNELKKFMQRDNKIRDD